MSTRKVNTLKNGTNFMYLPKEWCSKHEQSGWDKKQLQLSGSNKLLLSAYPDCQSPFILCKTPLRLPLAGGGSDLPEYYTKHKGGMWLSVAINNYIYIVLKKRFEDQSKFVYSETQYVDNPKQFNHPILRAVLTKYNLTQHLELISIADLPARLGLGSSGAFTVGLLKAVHAFLGLEHTVSEVAEEAYEIERLSLGRKIGKQDQYATAFGGSNVFSCDEHGVVSVKSIDIADLQKWLLLFYVNQRGVSADQAIGLLSETDYEQIAYLGQQGIQALLNGDFKRYGSVMAQHWGIKGKAQPKIFSDLIGLAKSYGAVGAKLVGAGSGGCLLVCASPEWHTEIVNALQSAGCIQIQFKFEHFGSGVYQ